MNAIPEGYRLHAIIKGTVQGVGFRAFVMEQATSLGLTGWVRNTYDGSVEVTAEGPRTSLEKLLDRLRMGPRMAYVSEVKQDWQPANGEFRYFNIRSST